jgi:hypothetical protein
MEESPIAQGTGGGAVSVYPKRVEFTSGWQSQNIFSVELEQIASVDARGLINCTLTVEVNEGRRLNVVGMALPEALEIKAAIERQKSMAGPRE